MIDPGKWTVHTGPASVAFQQTLKSPIGIAYVYKKTLKLDPREPVLIIQHELKNTGTETIETQVYNHGLLRARQRSDGSEMVVRFPFAPEPERAFDQRRKDRRQGASLRPRAADREFVYTHFSGFSSAVSDFDFSVETARLA